MLIRPTHHDFSFLFPLFLYISTIIYRCLNNPDTIVIRDGLSPDSQVIGTICGAGHGQTQFLSTGPELVIVFTASNPAATAQHLLPSGDLYSAGSTVRPGGVRKPRSTSSGSSSIISSPSSQDLRRIRGTNFDFHEDPAPQIPMRSNKQQQSGNRFSDRSQQPPGSYASSPQAGSTYSAVFPILGRGFNATYRFVRRSLKPRFYLEDSEGTGMGRTRGRGAC